MLFLLADLIDKNVLDELRQNPPRYFGADQAEWLNKAIQKVKGISCVDILTVLIERFSAHYQSVRAFHGVARTLSGHTNSMGFGFVILQCLMSWPFKYLEKKNLSSPP